MNKCVYCGSGEKMTKDHLFARDFFPVKDRDRLPIVKSCLKCNAEKSKLEQYLAVLFLLGSVHTEANSDIEELNLFAKLKGNRKLWNILQDGYKSYNSTYSSIPFKYEFLKEWSIFIGQGLLQYYFKETYSREYFSVGWLYEDEIEKYEKIIEMADAHVDVNLQNRFMYKGAYFINGEYFYMIFMITIMGGISLTSDSDKAISRKILIEAGNVEPLLKQAYFDSSRVEEEDFLNGSSDR